MAGHWVQTRLPNRALERSAHGGPNRERIHTHAHPWAGIEHVCKSSARVRERVRVVTVTSQPKPAVHTREGHGRWSCGVMQMGRMGLDSLEG